MPTPQQRAEAICERLQHMDTLGGIDGRPLLLWATEAIEETERDARRRALWELHLLIGKRAMSETSGSLGQTRGSPLYEGLIKAQEVIREALGTILDVAAMNLNPMHVIYINIYPATIPESSIDWRGHATRDLADAAAGVEESSMSEEEVWGRGGRVACLQVMFMEGQGLHKHRDRRLG